LIIWKWKNENIPEGDSRDEELYKKLNKLVERRMYLLQHNEFEVCKNCGSIIYPHEFKEEHVHRHKDLCVVCSRKYK